MRVEDFGAAGVVVVPVAVAVDDLRRIVSELVLLSTTVDFTGASFVFLLEVSVASSALITIFPFATDGVGVLSRSLGGAFSCASAGVFLDALGGVFVGASSGVFPRSTGRTFLCAAGGVSFRGPGGVFLGGSGRALTRVPGVASSCVSGGVFPRVGRKMAAGLVVRCVVTNFVVCAGASPDDSADTSEHVRFTAAVNPGSDSRERPDP